MDRYFESDSYFETKLYNLCSGNQPKQALLLFCFSACLKFHERGASYVSCQNMYRNILQVCRQSFMLLLKQRQGFKNRTWLKKEPFFENVRYQVLVSSCVDHGEANNCPRCLALRNYLCTTLSIVKIVPTLYQPAHFKPISFQVQSSLRHKLK